MRDYLQAYAETCNTVKAAKKAGVNRYTHYDWMKTNPIYAEAFNTTKQLAADYIESKAIERAIEGWAENIFFQGEKCGETQHYETSLLIFLLKGLMPEKYGQKATGGDTTAAPVQAQIEVTFVRPDAEIQSARVVPEFPRLSGNGGNGHKE